jgi:hypothetical protein
VEVEDFVVCMIEGVGKLNSKTDGARGHLPAGGSFPVCSSFVAFDVERSSPCSSKQMATPIYSTTAGLSYPKPTPPKKFEGAGDEVVDI